MSDVSLVLIAVAAVLNVTAFLLMWRDKVRSQHDGAERISEGLLFFLAAAFGSVGVYAGMFAFRHKTRKWYFLIGIPLIALENAAFLYLVLLVLGGSEFLVRVAESDALI